MLDVMIDKHVFNNQWATMKHVYFASGKREGRCSFLPCV